jgi:hypothetical protein
LEFDPFEYAKQHVSSEYPGKITLSSQIQNLMKLWAVVVNRGIQPWVVAGHFKEMLASPNKQYT